MDWASPKTYIVILAVLGFLIWGVFGFIAGIVGGFVLTILISLFVNFTQGGAVPRRVRRDLITNVLVHFPEDVRAAYPSLRGNHLFAAMESDLERVVKEAVTFAPSHDTIFDEGVMHMAFQSTITKESDSAKKDLLKDMYEQLVIDWYGHGIFGRQQFG